MLPQVLQSKHDALLKRVDDLSNECEELRDRVLEAEGEKDKLQGVIKDLQTEKTKLFEQLNSKQVIYGILSFVLVVLVKILLSLCVGC